MTVDARNHGESPHTDVIDYKSMSADVVQLLTDLGLQRVNILGHSMGGKTAMTLALTQVRCSSHINALRVLKH